MAIRNISWSNRRQIAGDSITWALNPSTPLGLEIDLNPGETRYLLFARKFTRGAITIASEYGLDENDGRRAAIELELNSCEGLIKMVSADSFPVFYHVQIDLSADQQMVIKRIVELNAKNLIKSFEKHWKEKLMLFNEEEASKASLQRAEKVAFESRSLGLKTYWEANKDKPSPNIRILIDNRFGDVGEVTVCDIAQQRNKVITTNNGHAEIVDFAACNFKHKGSIFKFDGIGTFTEVDAKYFIFFMPEVVAGLDGCLKMIIVPDVGTGISSYVRELSN